jgi:ATP-dependent RNA helicase DeaD
VAGHETRAALVNVLRFFDAPTALVFCATRLGVQSMQEMLLARGFSSVALSGELSQNERTRALAMLREGQARVCVATDVAARGLDLPDLGLVVHADLPTNPATLLHRSGRTGRAGRKGVCVLISAASRQRRTEQLLQQAGVVATWAPPPTAAEIRALDAERMLADPQLAAEASEEDAALARQLLAAHPPEQVAAALIRLSRAGRPAPEEVSVPSPADRRPERTARANDVPGAPREAGEMVWFTMDLGRDKKADPKWLLPLICRLGEVTKRDVGSIKIGERETRFEIRADAADAFAASIPQGGRDEVTIRPAAGPLANSAMVAPPRRRFDRPTASSRKRRSHAG